MLKSIPELIKEVSEKITTITAEEAKREMAENNGLLVDVREPAETQAKPSPGAVNIPRGLVEVKLPELAKSADHPIYIHCASSVRAKLAAEQLQRIGYENVKVITCDVETICSHIS